MLVDIAWIYLIFLIHFFIYFIYLFIHSFIYIRHKCPKRLLNTVILRSECFMLYFDLHKLDLIRSCTRFIRIDQESFVNCLAQSCMTIYQITFIFSHNESGILTISTSDQESSRIVPKISYKDAL